MRKHGLLLVVFAAFLSLSWRGGEKPRVLLYYDMEGISGIDKSDYTRFGNPLYREGQTLLTQDVNAAIRGLIRGGVGEIMVTDAHGSGNPEPDIFLDDMDPRARFEWRDRPFRPYIDSPNDSYDAIVCIGMHAGAGFSGFLSHTFTIEPLWKINGLEFNETMIVAQSAARFGIPLIMVSGDDVLGVQIQEIFPKAEYAIVKEAVDVSSATLFPSEEAMRRIEDAAAAAVEKLQKEAPEPWSLPGPYRWEISFLSERQAEWASIYPGVERVNSITVGFNVTDWIHGYEVSTEKVIPLARRERIYVLQDIVKEMPEAQQIMQQFEERLLQRLYQGYPPVRPVPTPEPQPRYHGVR
ncbi:M55 family metallopeptidase [Acidobacteria bacterium AH-259-L09]|nr:M55 family metallopeptidase [Acidobacteria bacterium AH-259-L09]